jgi:hypothetical protein
MWSRKGKRQRGSEATPLTAGLAKSEPRADSSVAQSTYPSPIDCACGTQGTQWLNPYDDLRDHSLHTTISGPPTSVCQGRRAEMKLELVCALTPHRGLLDLRLNTLVRWCGAATGSCGSPEVWRSGAEGRLLGPQPPQCRYKFNQSFSGPERTKGSELDQQTRPRNARQLLVNALFVPY